MRIKLLFIGIIAQFFMQCTPAQENYADSIIIDGVIYTVNDSMPLAEAIAIKEGKILYVGSNTEALKFKGKKTVVTDAKGAFILPGLIEGHGHFSNMGYSLINLNLLHSKSWDEIAGLVKEKTQSAKSGDWIEGRGWHQEKWKVRPNETYNGYPYHNLLSEMSPENPVVLVHASGHALFANKKAMELSGITAETADPLGGRIVRDHKGTILGVFEENAMDLIYTPYQNYLKGLDPKEEEKKWMNAIEAAQQECLRNGITSFQDAGSKLLELDRYKALTLKDSMHIRLWAMARQSYDEMKPVLKNYITKSEYYTCNAIKSEVDGALGSFGAWLLEPYADKAGFTGQNTTPIPEIERIAMLARDLNMQMCVHAIGDRANRTVIDIYEKYLPKNEDRRWRIEHTQHINPTDIPRLKKNNIIASMQAIHCTSDAPFVEKRLGYERAKNGAYAWRSMIDAGVVVTNGTDVPVEEIDPIKNLYASVTRKRTDDGMEFFPEQKMTRKEAIKAYTMNNAYAVFEEKVKGSLEKGKYADMVVLSQDISKCSDEDILKTKVLCTIVAGKIKFGKI